MTGEWARQDIFTGISDKVIISVLSKDDPHIQAALCTTVKLNLEWRFHFPSSWPQPLVFFPPPRSSPATAETVPSEPRSGHTDGPSSLMASVMFSQRDAVSKPASGRSPQGRRGPGGDREGRPIREGSSAPLRTPEGKSATAKRTVSFSCGRRLPAQFATRARRPPTHTLVQCSAFTLRPVPCRSSLFRFVCIGG